MSFRKIYNILIVSLLLIFFVTSYLLGLAISSKESEEIIIPKKETGALCLEAEMKNAENETSKEDDKIKYYDISLTLSEQKYVYLLSVEYGLDPAIVYGVMHCESSYEEDEISEVGDWGIMQINAVNHEELRRELGVTDFLDFRQNVLCGIHMLSEYYNQYNDIHMALMCYHFGETGATRLWEQGVYQTDYTRAVVAASEELTIIACEY